MFNFDPHFWARANRVFLANAILSITHGLLCTAAELPGNFEVDLVFPRNETYSPVPIFPVVFGVQNTALNSDLYATISWSIYRPDDREDSRDGGSELSQSLNGSLTDPFLWTFWTDRFLYGLEGSWVFNTTLYVGHCLDSTGNAAWTEYTKTINFTTKNGAQAPDLVAATSKDTCATSETYNFNVTKLEPAKHDSSKWDKSSCAIFATGTSPTASPCAVAVNQSAASSISAAATSSFCAESYLPLSVLHNKSFNCRSETILTPSPTISAGILAKQASGMQITWLTTILVALFLHRLI